MQRREYLLSLGAVAASTSVGAVAYTSASTQRDVSIGIAADNNAQIGLTAGSTDAVGVTNGLLNIDTSTTDADGLNADSTFTYGDPSNPSTTFAFSLTNNASGSRDFTLGLTNFTLGGSSAVTFSVYNADGTLAGDLTPATDQTVTLASAGTVYVVIEIVTDGLTSADNMNGTFTINSQ